MRPQNVDGWLNECAAVAERGAERIVYELILDGRSEGYITATCDAHAANVARKYHGAAEVDFGWRGRTRALLARSK